MSWDKLNYSERSCAITILKYKHNYHATDVSLKKLFWNHTFNLKLVIQQITNIYEKKITS